ncbi:hypothetical protein MMC13_004019 [Lambiella insularis]|nr:hypothetical protein [Lambiella insularis]
MASNQITVSKALELVRNSETGEVHPGVDATLEREISKIWQRISARPNEYVMNKEEFAVFNYFQDRFRGNRTAQLAIGRFWKDYKGSPSQFAGYRSN